MSTPLALEDALERILARAVSVGETRVLPLVDALGCVLARDCVADIDVPGADNSAMDGYALRAAEAGRALRVTQRIPAGAAAQPLPPGCAARIFTGAVLPEGADAVAMQEDCVEAGGRLEVKTGLGTGDNVRPRGQDIAAGEQVLSAGRRLRPQDLGLLASVGVSRVEVYRPLRVALLATGDELVEPGAAVQPGPGQVYNSNRFTLAGLVRGLGMDLVDYGIVRDDPRATAAALGAAAASADCVITSGGVSVGEEDHVRNQVARLGHIDLWKLAIKPGKPLAFGDVQGTPFIGLPGNPTSVFVTFCLVARPFLLRCQGANEPDPPRFRARANFSVERAGSRRDYLRVQVSNLAGGLCADRFSNQSSGVLSSVSRSNALAVIPPGATVARGEEVEILLLDLLA